MGVTAAIGAGLSVAGGVVGLNQQQKQANAQKKMIEAQEQQQRLQAQLQLFALRNQRLVDKLQDTLQDAAQKQAYLQTDAALKIQEQLNTLATGQAIFQHKMNLLKADVQERLAEMQTRAEESNAKQQAAAQFLQVLGSGEKDSQQFVESLIDNISKSDNARTVLASLLDVAAASGGGVNETLQMLLSNGEFEGVRNAAALARQDEIRRLTNSRAESIRDANMALADVNADLAMANATAQGDNARYLSRLGILDAATAQATAGAAFNAQRLANEQNYRTGIMSNELVRSSRYLQSLANEEALQQGQMIASDTLNAQKSAIRSPGLFDYLGVGLNAYNTYNQLSYRPPAIQPQ